MGTAAGKPIRKPINPKTPAYHTGFECCIRYFIINITLSPELPLARYLLASSLALEWFWFQKKHLDPELILILHIHT